VKCTLGVIGTGKMGSALVRGLVRAGALAADRITVCDADSPRAAALAQELGVVLAGTNGDVAAGSEYVLLAVKPGAIQGVLGEIAPALSRQQTVVSIAAGVTIARIRALVGEAGPAIIRVMPNTPALVGAGVLAVAAPGVEEDRKRGLVRLLEAVGTVVEVGEDMMDAVTGLSGSGPAFVFMMIEALAEGGVATGLPSGMAMRLAVETVAGAARLVQETGEHPETLKKAVASPGGTTEAGLAELERGGFGKLVASAVRAAAQRSRELSSGGASTSSASPPDGTAAPPVRQAQGRPRAESRGG
jgi:pyrroline-5-carboxylate reductase